MDDEHPGGSEDVAGKGKQPSAKDLLKESTVEALNVLDNTREVTGRPKQVAVGAMLTTSLAFLIALVGIQRLDKPLSIAAVAVGVAIPLLGVDFIIISLDFSPNLPPFIVNLLKLSAFICEGLGGLGVVVALLALLWHLSVGAVVAAVIALGLALLAPSLVTVAIVLWLVILVRKAKSRGADTEETVRKSPVWSLLTSRVTNSSETQHTPS